MAVAGVGTRMELGTREEQVQGVALYGAEWQDAPLYFCKISPSVCLLLC